MRIAVISDVHGNLHALEAVLAELDGYEVWCLGDTVGYGPRPNECCALVAERASLCLAGNHDLVVSGALGLEEFAHDAAIAAGWARDVLTAESRAFLRRLHAEAHRDGVALFHASARDPVWEYILSAEAALATLEATTEPLVLVGHSHVALALGLEERRLGGGLAPDGARVDLAAARWLLNPGSVGQPRDGDPRAAWLELDLEGRSAAFHRVPYPIERTQAEMRAEGLPKALAARLARGE